MKGFLLVVLASGFMVSVSILAQAANVADFVLIKEGTFIMGSPATEAWREKDESPHALL